MFSYYGSKSKVIDLYPSPKHKRVIEPFAGSARYAMKYHWCDVLLVDKYQVVVNVWKWLQSCTAKDILDLPRMKQGDNVDNYDLPQVAKDFLGFIVTRGVQSPRKNVSSFVGDITPKLLDVSKKVSLIKHWEIRLGSYADIQNETATWFIDPPYQFGGEHYVENNQSINFQSLGEWCKSRNGQIIVCENTKADWLPFKAMREMTGSQHTTVEAIWSNMPHDFESVQLGLFDADNTLVDRATGDFLPGVREYLDLLNHPGCRNRPALAIATNQGGPACHDAGWGEHYPTLARVEARYGELAEQVGGRLYMSLLEG